METTTDNVEVESLSDGELVYRANEPSLLHMREDGDGQPMIEGRMMPYDEWTEIRSTVEGHFMERFSPGSLAKTMSEQKSKIRALFEHGMDAFLGRQAIAEIHEFDDRQDGAYYRASVLEGLPPLIVSGLRRGLYGSSVRFRPIKFERVRSPRPSDHNPDGIPEITVREAQIREVSIVTFPQYAGATAAIRSLTDEIAAKQLIADPSRLLEIIQTARATEEQETEPQHSGREEQLDAVPERSRSTQPQRDYLNPDKEKPKWLIP